MPAVNQIEVHPYFANEAARAATARHGAHVEAWSPLGQGGGELKDPVVTEPRGPPRQDARAGPAALGRSTAATSSSPSLCARSDWRENFDVFDFSLAADEIAALAALDKGEDGRQGPNPDTFDWIP